MHATDVCAYTEYVHKITSAKGTAVAMLISETKGSQKSGERLLIPCIFKTLAINIDC